MEQTTRCTETMLGDGRGEYFLGEGLSGGGGPEEMGEQLERQHIVPNSTSTT